MSLSKTTKLQAVNTMLSVIGELPVNSLSTQRADSLMAQGVLEEVVKEVLTYGWQFNTDENYEMVPEAVTGYIYVPEAVVRVDTEPSEGLDVVIRGNKLYDRGSNSYAFTGPLKVTRVFFMDFDELPEVARRYIAIRAARIYQDRSVGSDKSHMFNGQDEVVALARMVEYESDVGDFNIFDSFDASKALRMRGGGYRV